MCVNSETNLCRSYDTFINTTHAAIINHVDHSQPLQWIPTTYLRRWEPLETVSNSAESVASCWSDQLYISWTRSRMH